MNTNSLVIVHSFGMIITLNMEKTYSQCSNGVLGFCTTACISRHLIVTNEIKIIIILLSIVITVNCDYYANVRQNKNLIIKTQIKWNYEFFTALFKFVYTRIIKKEHLTDANKACIVNLLSLIKVFSFRKGYIERNNWKPYRGYSVDRGKRQNWISKDRVSFDRVSPVTSPLSALTYTILANPS